MHRLARRFATTAAAAILMVSMATSAASPVPPPLPPLPQSPVATFRQLLAQSPAERSRALSLRPEKQRETLASRLAEYDVLTESEREQRLQATDLYWHLQQLLRRAPSERDVLLAAAPAELHAILRERLRLWDDLPESDRQSLLQHERAIRYFARLRAVQPPPLPPSNDRTPTLSAAPAVPIRVQLELGPLQQLTPEQRERARRQWSQFFETPAPRVQRTLQAMDARERAAMEQVLERFRKLNPEQRQTCIDSFVRFTTLTPVERAEFLRRAELWEKLPTDERSAWRGLVNKLPLLPPLPPTAAAQPPLPAVRSNPRLAGSSADAGG